MHPQCHPPSYSDVAIAWTQIQVVRNPSNDPPPRTGMLWSMYVGDAVNEDPQIVLEAVRGL